MPSPNKPRPIISLEIERGTLALIRERGPLAVYCVLCKSASSKGRDCYPSLSTIAELAGVDTSTVCRAIKKLEELGLIARTRDMRKRRKSTIYLICERPQDTVPDAHSQNGLLAPGLLAGTRRATVPGASSYCTGRGAPTVPGALPMGIECLAESQMNATTSASPALSPSATSEQNTHAKNNNPKAQTPTPNRLPPNLQAGIDQLRREAAHKKA